MPTQLPAEPTGSPGGGTMSSLSRMKRDTSYTLAELQDFLAQMRGRSPQEVLGMVSASELIRGIVIATIGCVVLVGVLTIVPYALRDKPTATAAPEATAASSATTPAASPATAAAPAVTDTDSKTGTSAENLSAAAKALDIDEVKAAPPDVNPLDKDLDKLLDGKE